MRYLPPVPWRNVRPGTVVLDRTGTPRAVLINWENLGTCFVLLEGDPNSHYVSADQPITPVELGTADAIGTLHTAGFTVTPIGDQPS